jgi:hypothetical protein
MKKWYFIIFLLSCIPTWVSIALGIGTPFDEMAHFDYADKLAHLELPKVNEQYGQRTLRIIACQEDDPGVAWAGVRDCDAPIINSSAAPFNGQSSATSYAPTFYGLTAINYRICDSTLGRAIDLAPLTCMRIANSMFSGATAITLVAIGTLVGFPVVAASAAALIALNSPALIQQFATVNTDAGAAFAIAGSIYAGIWFGKRQRIFVNGYWPVSLNKNLLNLNVFFYVLVLTFLISIKETSILILPTATLLFYRFGSCTISSDTADNSEPKGLPQQFLLLCSFLVTGVIALSVGFLRWVQPHWRGTGGEDWMSIALRGDGQLTLNAILTPITHFFSSSAQLVWPRLSNSMGYSVSTLLGTVFAATVLLGNLNWQQIRSNNATISKIFGQTLQLGILSVVPMVVLLGLLSWLQAGFVISQPRYYLPTTTAFGAFVLMFLFAFLKDRTVFLVLGVFSLLLMTAFIIN